jgi:hypothetical protein
MSTSTEDDASVSRPGSEEKEALTLYDPESITDPDQQYPAVNRITQVGNGSLEQMLVNAQTYNNLSPDEEGARQSILDVSESIRQANEQGVDVDVGKYRINGTGNAADLGMMLTAAKADIEQQMERQKEQELKAEAVKKEEEDKAKSEDSMEESRAIQSLIGSAAFIGAAAAAGTALPAFLMNPMAPNMPGHALSEAKSAGVAALSAMGVNFLAMSQTMGNEALCQDTHHGLSVSGQQRSLEAGLA